MKTIAIDASRANHEQKTGVEWYAFHLIQALKKTIPTTVRVILYTDKPLHGELADLPSNWSEKILKWPLVYVWTQCRMSYELMRHPVDVLFVPAHVPPLIQAKHTVVTIHDTAAAVFPAAYSRFEQWYSLYTAKHAVKHASHVIVPSLFVKEALIKLCKKNPEASAQISVIHHGLDPIYTKTYSQSLHTSILKKYHLNHPYFISVGRIETKKNTLATVRAFEHFCAISKHTNIELILVGKAGHGSIDTETAVARSPYRDRIHLLGYVNPADLPILVTDAIALVFPTLYEGFGLPLIEALASGTPVIASQGICLEEIGADQATYVNPHHVEAICDAMIEMCSTKQTETMKEQRKQRATLFSWEKTAVEVTAVLTDNMK